MKRSITKLEVIWLFPKNSPPVNSINNTSIVKDSSLLIIELYSTAPFTELILKLLDTA